VEHWHGGLSAAPMPSIATTITTTAKACTWMEKANIIASYHVATDGSYSLAKAQSKCLELGTRICNAITCSSSGQCTLRPEARLEPSSSGETSYIPTDVCFMQEAENEQERAAAKEKAERNAEEQAEKDKDEEKNNYTKHQSDALHRESEEIFARVAAEEQAASEHDHQVELNKARARVGAIEKQLAADDVARKTAEAQAKEDDDNGKAALRRSVEDISKHLGELDDELKAMKEIEERMAAEKVRLVAIQENGH